MHSLELVCNFGTLLILVTEYYTFQHGGLLHKAMLGNVIFIKIVTRTPSVWSLNINIQNFYNLIYLIWPRFNDFVVGVRMSVVFRHSVSKITHAHHTQFLFSWPILGSLCQVGWSPKKQTVGISCCSTYRPYVLPNQQHRMFCRTNEN